MSVDPTGMVEKEPPPPPGSKQPRSISESMGAGGSDPGFGAQTGSEKKEPPTKPTEVPKDLKKLPPAEQINVLQKVNDAKKLETDKALVKNYLSSVAGKTTKSAIAGAIAGSPVPLLGTAGGAIVTGLAGLSGSAVMGGIELREQFKQAESDWKANYDAIQNYSDLGAKGEAPPIRYTPTPTYNPIKEVF